MNSSTKISGIVVLAVTLSISTTCYAILNDSLNVTTSTEANRQDNNTNATFYYEANAFLLNNNHNSTNQLMAKSQPLVAAVSEDLQEVAEGQQKQHSTKETTPQPQKRVKPASMAATSGRSGRAMDLDALVGDVAASKANKELSLSGARQSRQFLPGLPDVGPGKKLHIQGFIPIMGVKDATPGDEDDEQSSQHHPSASSLESQYAAYLTQQQQQQHHHQQQKHKPRAQTLSSITGNDLPYAQSSIGHATYGVHRYLNGDPQPQQQQLQQHHQQFYDSSHVGEPTKAASVVETIRRPIKKLAELAGANQYSSLISRPSQQHHQQQQQQVASGGQCLCVPFYMCKNGFISESGLGKQQIQQMIAQQQLNQMQHQQQQRPPQMSAYDQIEMKSSLISPQVQQQQQQQQQLVASSTQAPQTSAQYADSYVPVDERSLDRELITMSSLINFNQDSAANQTMQANENSQTPSVSSELSAEQQQQQLEQLAALQQNSTDSKGDYSDEILGRMLGLKAANQRQSSSPGGVCGLLRTCCQVPINFPYNSQQDLMNDKMLAQLAFQQQQQQQQHQQFQAPQIQRVSSPANSMSSHHQQQVQPMQPQSTSLMQQVRMQQQQTPYGFPSNSIPTRPQQQQQQQNLYSQQQAYGMNQFNPQDNMLAHRTNQIQTSVAQQQQQQQQNRYQMNQQQVAQPSTQLAEYTRSSSNGQQFHSFQQQQQPLQQRQLPSLTRSLPLGLQQQQQQPQTTALAGTRKILEGRCGLRQAMGVTGRVQNLQYHESSAEFGEYPAQAAILKRLPGADSLFVCGGTLISQYWIATAAHCIKKHSAQGELKVRLGEWDVHRDDEFYPFVEKDVRDIVIHPEFVSGNLANDLALLRLDTPVDPTLPHINPACLPAIDEVFDRQSCWVTGWGKDSFGQRGSFQSVLKEVELPVIGHGMCEQALRQTRLGPHYRLNQGFICAGGEGGKDACEGDGGSGLYCAQDGVVKVAGLVSWGIGCGQAGVPGVYVNMAHYRPWIESIISIDEDIYSPFSNMLGANNSPISERSNSNSTILADSSLDSATATTTTTTSSTTQAPSSNRGDGNGGNDDITN